MAREYKDSGIEWIGRIPKEWKTCNLKRLLSFNNGQDYKHVESNEGYPVYGSGGVFVHACQYLYDGESILFGRKGTIDRPLYVNEKFWTVDTMYYAIPQKDTCGKYLYYLATLLPFNKYQTSTALPSMTQTILGDMVVVCPSLLLQQKIADYLDKKCEEIDSLISLQEQMIAQLTDYKQAIITEAVTKGLDPNAQLVPSGIDWIGDIPKGWKVARIKNVASLYGRIGFRGYTSDDLNKDGVGAITLSPSNMLSMKMDYTNVTYLSWEKYYESPEIMIQNGDLLMVKTGSSYGKVSYVDNLPREATINPQILRIIPKIESKYLGFYLQTQLFLYQVDGGVVGGTIPTIAQEKINNFKVVLPSFDEQRTIVYYLDNKCAEIDALISLKQQKIETLKDYKKSLIYECVTGKIEVE
jgi:type I restriction enzyme S subunit